MKIPKGIFRGNLDYPPNGRLYLPQLNSELMHDIGSLHCHLSSILTTRVSGGAPSAVRWNQLLADRSFAALFLSRHPFAFGNLLWIISRLVEKKNGVFP
jgi:hypothetical protein